MTDHAADYPANPPDLFETEATRCLLDQLLTDSRLYRHSKDYNELLNFIVRLRNFAPFNAMLLQVQKPGLTYAASARDWRERFERTIKEGARPLLILWPFGPVALVYDVMDTEGKSLPQDVQVFFASGDMNTHKLSSFEPMLNRKNIHWNWVDEGDANAGSIRIIHRAIDEKDATLYQININKNHQPVTQFVTLVHELAHLCLGHLGPDKKLSIPQRPKLSHVNQELEAESVAFIVSQRNGIEPKSQTYLSGFVNQNTTADQLDIYQIMRAAGQVEVLLNIASHEVYAKQLSSAELKAIKKRAILGNKY